MLGSFKIAKILGIPIRVHFTLLILLPYFAHRFSQALEVTQVYWGWLAAAGVFISVALHELGHSVVALRYGCTVRDIILTPIGGIAQLARIPSKPSAEFQIAIAGPLVSLALGILFWSTKSFLFSFGWLNFGKVIFLLGATNIVLFAFNLIPCFPMDGGRIFRALMSKRWGRLEATRKAVKLGAYLAAMLAILGIYHFNFFWVLIAWFVYSAAQAEYRAVRMEEIGRQNPFSDFFSQRPFNRTQPSNDVNIHVGPPPYE